MQGKGLGGSGLIHEAALTRWGSRGDIPARGTRPGEADHVVKFGTGQGFFPEQLRSDPFELVAPGGEDFPGLGIAAGEEFFDFLIDFTSGGFARIALEGGIRAAEHSVLALSDMGEANALVHPIEADDLAGQGSGALQVIFRAGADFAENEFLRGASPEEAADFLEEFTPGGEELFLGRQLHGVAEGGAPARDDADLVHRVAVFAMGGNEGMADFVIGHAAFFLFVQAAAFAFGTGHDLFHGLIQIMLADLVATPAGGEQRGFVDGIGEVRA